MFSRIILIAVSVVLLLGTALTRCAYESRGAYRQGERLEAEGKILEAAASFSKVLRWRVPFVSYDETARKILELSQKNKEHEVQIVELLYSGLRSSRSFLYPQESGELIDSVNSRLMELRGAKKVRESIPLRVNYVSQILGQVAFWCFLGGLVWGMWSGIKPEGEVDKKRMGLSFLCAGGAYLAWIVFLSIP